MLVVFPGQGSQKIGMGKDIYDNFQAAKDVFNEVDDSLNFKLSELIFDGNPEDLKATQNTQPALMTVSMALVRVLETEFGFDVNQAKYLAGHSLGEYTALCASKVLSLRDTAKILRIRGSAMASAFPFGGAMAAILGLDVETVERIVDSISEEDNIVQIANDNSVGQIVISGHQNAVTQAMNKAIELKARRVLQLQVSGPFHSKLMQPAVDGLRDALENITFNEAETPIITNITANAETTDFKNILLKQLTGQVRWRESILYAEQHGITCCLEIGEGTVLTSLVKRISSNMELLNINSVESLSKINDICGKFSC
ncbi:MAG: ACP S-malonyltransferase [Alphaproteobacteria bacterium]|nr:ACP S-malonyltransferase [Alphaproteobacteria bacterium]